MKKFYILFIALFALTLTCCSSDEPNPDPNPVPTPSQPDPEQTVTVSIYKGSETSIDGLTIGQDDNFTSSRGNWRLVSLGKTDGLAAITAIPFVGWKEFSKVELGYGYIGYNISTRIFYRLFISNLAKDEMGTITGYQVKYTKNFSGKDVPLKLSSTTLDFEAIPSETAFVEIQNDTYVPFTYECSESWLHINFEYLDDAFLPSAISVWADKNNRPDERSTQIILTTEAGNKSTISVTQQGRNLQATTTIQQLKESYWSDEENYAQQIISDELIVIKGTIISSDEAGNVFKSLTIRDESAAITFAINAHSLYNKYPIGHEITVILNNMYIGKYAGWMEIGESSWYANDKCFQISFMPEEQFAEAAICDINGSAKTIEPYIVDISEFVASNRETCIKWQSQFVRFNNIEFLEQNVPIVGDSYTSVNHIFRNADGLQMILRTSNYCNFKDMLLPTGVGDIQGILTYYRDWQLCLNSSSDILTFDPNKTFIEPTPPTPPTPTPGTYDAPYTCAQVAALNNPGEEAWVWGYIVGAVDSYYQPTFGSNVSVANNIIIADSPNVSDTYAIVPIQLLAGTVLRSSLNLVDNPNLLGKKYRFYGKLEKYYGMCGIKSISYAEPVQ